MITDYPPYCSNPVETLYTRATRNPYKRYRAALAQLNIRQLHTFQSRNPHQAFHKGCVALLPFADIADTRVCEVLGVV